MLLAMAPLVGGWLTLNGWLGFAAGAILLSIFLRRGQGQVMRRSQQMLVLATVLFPAVGGSQGVGRNPAPPMPWIARNECPGEGCSLGKWSACSVLVVRREPRQAASVAFTLNRGDRFVAEAGDVYITAPGMVVFRDTGTITQSYEWSPPLPKERTYRFSPSDTLYLLNTLAEGYFVWWLHGRADTGMFFWRSKTAGVYPHYDDAAERCARPP
jgi:hypothetical protein